MNPSSHTHRVILATDGSLAIVSSDHPSTRPTRHEGPYAGCVGFVEREELRIEETRALCKAIFLAACVVVFVVLVARGFGVGV